MRTTALLLLMLVVFHGKNLFGEDKAKSSVQIRPIQMIFNDSLPSNIDMMVQPLGYKPGFQIYYLVSGENLVGVGPLKIDIIKSAEEKDISKDSKGNPSYELGMNPQISKDRTFALFHLDVDSNQFGKSDKIVLKGAVTISTAVKSEEKNIVLNMESKEEIKEGPFSILMKNGPSDSPALTIKGPVRKIRNIEIKNGDRDISNGYSWEGDEWNSKSRDYDFTKPKDGKIVLKLIYWIDMKEVEVPFGNN